MMLNKVLKNDHIFLQATYINNSFQVRTERIFDSFQLQQRNPIYTFRPIFTYFSIEYPNYYLMYSYGPNKTQHNHGFMITQNRLKPAQP